MFQTFRQPYRVFTAQRYANVVYVVVVCLIHAGIVSKRLNLGSLKQRHTMARDFSIFMPKI